MNVDVIHIASWTMFGATLLNAGALLWLQWRAYSKHHHRSFLILTLSTLVALLSFFTLSLPVFVPAIKSLYTLIYISSVALYILYASLGIWGVASLFRSYSALRRGI